MSYERDPEGIETKYLYEFADFDHARVLEIGCGDGRLTWLYANSARRVIAIDPHGEDLAELQNDRPKALGETLTLTQATAEALPFPRQTFDLAVLAWSL